MDLFSILKGEDKKFPSVSERVEKFLGSESTRKRKDYFYASGIGVDACLRALVYSQLIDTVERVIGRTQRIWDVGKAMHDDFDRYFERMGILLGNEVSFKKRNISGRIDDLIEGDSRIVVVEMKTMKSSQWTSLKMPPTNYEGQLLIYLWAVAEASRNRKIKKRKKDSLDRLVSKLSSMMFEQSPLGVLYIENKDTQQPKEFFYTYEDNKEKISDLLKMTDKVMEFLKNEELPPRASEVKTSYVCRFCGYKKVCFSNTTFKEIKNGGE